MLYRCGSDLQHLTKWSLYRFASCSKSPSSRHRTISVAMFMRPMSDGASRSGCPRSRAQTKDESRPVCGGRGTAATKSAAKDLCSRSRQRAYALLERRALPVSKLFGRGRGSPRDAGLGIVVVAGGAHSELKYSLLGSATSRLNSSARRACCCFCHDLT